MLWVNIHSPGWIIMVSMALWLFLAFTERKKILRMWIFYPILFLPAVFFIYKQWTGSLISDFVWRPYGWRLIWSTSVWSRLFHIYCVLFIGLGLLSLVRFWKRTSDPAQRKQSKIIFLTGASSYFLGVITNVVFTWYRIDLVPDIASVLVLIWALGLLYAIIKYKLLIFSPEKAYENIIATMADALILVDLKEKIITINNAALGLLGVTTQVDFGQDLKY